MAARARVCACFTKDLQDQSDTWHRGERTVVDYNFCGGGLSKEGEGEGDGKGEGTGKGERDGEGGGDGGAGRGGETAYGTNCPRWA